MCIIFLGIVSHYTSLYGTLTMLKMRWVFVVSRVGYQITQIMLIIFLEGEDVEVEAAEEDAEDAVAEVDLAEAALPALAQR